MVNLPTFSLFLYRDDAGSSAGATRRWWKRSCARPQMMTRFLAEGFTIVLGGDCTLVAGTVAGASRTLGQPVGVI